MAKKKVVKRKRVKKMSNGGTKGRTPKSKGDKFIERKLDKRRKIIGSTKTYTV